MSAAATQRVAAFLDAPALAQAAPVTFDAVYATHASYVWRVLRRLGVRDADVDDVGQDVFIVVHRKLATFDGRASLRAWIHGVAFRCASQHRRKSHVRREVCSENLDAREGDAPEAARFEARNQLDRLLDRLDFQTRALVVMYELEGLPVAEAAEVVGIATPTAYTRLQQARQKLQAAIVETRAGGER